jgi:hypothetical protein
VAQALALVGFAIGALIVFAAAPFAAGPLETIGPPARGLIALTGMAIIVLVAQATRIGFRRGAPPTNGTAAYWAMSTNASGALFGMVRGVFLVWAGAGLLAWRRYQRSKQRRASRLFLRVMDTQLPSRSCWPPSWGG